MSPKQDFKKKLLCSTLHPGTIPFLGISGRNTIPIQFATKIPLPGTIGKNHIQSRFHFLKRSALFTALNMILSLGIIPQQVQTSTYKNEKFDKKISQKWLNCKKYRKSAQKTSVKLPYLCPPFPNEYSGRF